MTSRRHPFFVCKLVCVGTGTALAVALPPAALADGEVRLDHSPSILAIAISIAVALVIFLILRKVARRATGLKVSELSLNSSPPAGGREKLAEEEDFSKFINEFRAGAPTAPSPLPPGTAALLSSAPAEPVGQKAQTSGDSLKEFFDWAPGQLGALRKLIEKSGRAEGPVAQRDLLVEACGAITLLKHRAGLPELRPAWQLATALEGLLKQLTGRVGNINHSTLRTVANGAELLGDLCAPGVRADLAANPAIRMLAVDDDAVSRFTVCAALKKAFDLPELAENGEAALLLARKQRYDLIILDVMMPGMDGFEVCTKIRQSAANASTPVLFVTALQDFDSRSKSLVASGNDLLGKPFLSFEITAKALTAILRARLRERDRIPGSPPEPAVHSAPAVAWPVLPPVPVPVPDADQALQTALPAQPDLGKDLAGAAPLVLLPPPVFAPGGPGEHEPGGTITPREFSPAFLEYIPACVAEMTDQIAVIGRTDEGSVRWEMLVRLHLRLKCLAPRIDVPELRPALEMCQSLEGLFKKFTEKPANATDSALRTATAGLQLFKDLCTPGVKPGLADNPPIRILVVDDEPLARRAVTGALQMAFSRPAAADSGEAALALAEDKEFDLVFMDVMMPQMDGFTACTRIHQTVHNRSTPVVFVTALSDQEFRAQAAACGGSDFVVKPFVFMEITVKALTFALRGRLEKLKTAQPPGTTAPG